MRFKGCEFLLNDAAILQIEPEEADAIAFVADVVKVVRESFQLAARADVAGFEVALLWQAP